MNCKIDGIVSAVVTPFSKDGTKLDEEAYKSLIHSQVKAGIHGVLVSGSTGEHPALSVNERKRLYEITKETASDSTTRVIAHIGCNNVHDAVELAYAAKEFEVDQALVVTPYFDRMKFYEVQIFLEKIVTILGHPIIYYDTPGITGLNISEGQMVELSKNGLVSHIKDSAGDFTRTIRMLNNPEAPTVLAGSDPALMSVLAHGARGSIIGASTFLPELCVDLYKAISLEQNLSRALGIWDKLWPILDFMLLNGYVALTKSGSAIRGLPVGEPREPISPATIELNESLKSIMERSNVL